MNTLTILKRVKSQKIGKLPVVILPLEDYEQIKEDLEMLSSRNLPRDIGRARKEVKRGETISFAEVKRHLRLS
ncbi:MAG: hypothetical protein ABIK20_01025 [Candidatus Omnitrophota bacterium]|nr:hypothetical protein [Candidatus Omnitrophota bacterium]